MQKFLIPIVLALVLSGSPAEAKTRVAEFSGSGNMTTAIFRVESPWVIDWRLDGDYEQMMGLEIPSIAAMASRCSTPPAFISFVSARRLHAGASRSIS